VPSRGDVEEYQNLRATVNELVGRINGRFGTVDFMPIHFMHKSLPFDELCALYAVSDVCLVSSTRDGMNLVSYEYIACQQARQGALVLSEFAGAAQSLNGSIVVNPWDSQQVADAIYEAVTMDSETRAENHRKLFKVLPLVCELESMDPDQHRSTSTSTRRHSGARASSRRWSSSTRRASRRSWPRLRHRLGSLPDCMYHELCTTIDDACSRLGTQPHAMHTFKCRMLLRFCDFFASETYHSECVVNGSPFVYVEQQRCMAEAADLLVLHAWRHTIARQNRDH
jgi:hypothetical protein